MSANRESESFQYATRLCERLPRCLQENRENAKLSRYGLQKSCGVSRDMIGNVENGTSVPTVFLLARMAFGMGLKLKELVERLEDDQS